MLDISLAPVIVVAPDSFKGSLGASEVAQAIASGIRNALPNAVVRLCPMADGGEGTLDAMVNGGGHRMAVAVRGADGRERAIDVGITSDGSAIIETAAIVGLTDKAGIAIDVDERTSYGVGEAIRACLDLEIRRIFVALGGTSTNDGGAGMLAALGMRLFEQHGNEIEPVLKTLSTIKRADLSGLDERLGKTTIIGMSDVDNPLAGERGATAVFGQQKGVAADRIKDHDFALAHFANVVESTVGSFWQNAQGAGAAGGLGFALMAIGGRLESGAELVAKEVGLNEALEGADWLITGEGRSDCQTLSGKAPFVARRLARTLAVPATLLSGSLDTKSLPALGEHFDGCFSPIDGPMTLERAIQCAPSLLEQAAEQLVRLRYTPCQRS